MNDKSIISGLNNQTFSRNDLFKVAVSLEQQFSQTDIRNLLEKLLASDLIVRVGRNQYQKKSEIGFSEYQPHYSKKAKEIKDIISKQFPLIDFRVWELTLLNEFVNHQIAHNKIFVEVENDGTDFIYQTISEKYQNEVLLKPTSDEVYRYGKDDGIIIQRLVSESPRGRNDKYEITLEKLIVDMFASKLMSSFLTRGDYPAAIEDMFSKYYIDQVKLFRYAKRRNKADEIRDFLKQKTTVKIHSEEMR